MARIWTSSQKSAIDANNRDILVSAAAGSGKTSVLIERILQLIQSGASVERMLIVTFTKAAASEMRERLQRALTEKAAGDAHMADQLEALPLARISTLHSFCNELISRHGQMLGIETRLNLLSDLKNLPLTELASERTLNAFYENPDADAQILIKNYSEEQILEMLQLLFNASREEIEPEEWLDSLSREIADFNSEKALNAQLDFNFELLIDEVFSLIDFGKSLEQRAGYPEKYIGVFEKYERRIKEAQTKLKQGLLSSFELDRLPSVGKNDVYDEDLKDMASKLKGHIKDKFLEAMKLKPTGQKLKIELENINSTLPERRALVKLCKAFSREYALLKQEKNAIDYNDMEKLAYRILKDEGARQATSELFDYIFVDEYQDISRLQEALIQALHRDNALFMVGDVKQSIYRFRKAEPRLFIEKFDSFSDADDSKSRRISLSENFRSNRNILDAVNEVFSACMKKDVSEIDYDSNAMLKSPKSSLLDKPVELNILVKPDNIEEGEQRSEDFEKDEDSLDKDNLSQNEILSCEREASLIAKRIIELCQNEYITENGEKRKIEFRDIVILKRGLKSTAPIYSRVLLKYGIPLYSDKEARLYEIIEINDLICLLSFLDNPLLDEMLLSSLSSPLFGYSADDLASIRAEYGNSSCSFLDAFKSFALRDERAKKALDRLEKWRFEARQGSFKEFISKLLYDIGFYSLSGVLENPELRRNNLRRFVDEIYRSDMDLHSFISMARKLHEQRTEDAAPEVSALDNVVRLTTIHKSKGLEFPIVFITGLADKFLKDRAKLMLIDNELGLALPSTEGRQRTANILSKIILSKKRGEMISEEARLLYVAMTRAKERLILIAKLSVKLNRFFSDIAMPASRNRIYSADSLLDFIGLALREPLLELKDKNQFLYNGTAKWDLRLISDIQVKGRLSYSKSSFITSKDDFFELEPEKSEHLPQKIGISSLISLTESYVEQKKNKLSEMDERVLCLKSPDSKASEILLGFDKYREEGKKELDISHEDRPFEEMGLVFDENILKKLDLEGLKEKQIRGEEGSRSEGAFIEDETIKKQSSAEMGTSLHKLFYFASLEKLKELNFNEKTAYFKALAARLCEKQILSSRIIKKIDYSLPARFFESPLGQRLLDSDEVYREKSFIYLSQKGVVLRGVVDVVFREGSSYVLLDYKSDSDYSSLKPAHESQIGWYKQALSSLLEGGIKEAHVCYIRGPVSFNVE